MLWQVRLLLLHAQCDVAYSKLTSTIISLAKDSLPSRTIGTLYMSKIISFRGSLKIRSIQLDISTCVYMQNQSLIAADPQELRLAESTKGVYLDL